MTSSLFFALIFSATTSALPCEPQSPASSVASDIVTASIAAISAEQPVGDEARLPPFRDLVRDAVQALVATGSVELDALLEALPEVLAEAAEQEAGPATRRAEQALLEASEAAWSVVERALSLQLEVSDSRRFREEFLFPEDNPPELTARGQAILERIESASPARLGLRLNVLADGGHQAFAKGGENIYVSSDFFDLPEDELAAVIAHERAHLMERHLTQTTVQRSLARALEAAAPDALKPAAKWVGRVAEIDAQHQQEFQADAQGAGMLSAAGYDPGAMGSLIRRTGGAEQAAPFASDHPSQAARLAALEGRR
jgi:predicted Zn-dependent protease